MSQLLVLTPLITELTTMGDEERECATFIGGTVGKVLVAEDPTNN